METSGRLVEEFRVGVEIILSTQLTSLEKEHTRLLSQTTEKLTQEHTEQVKYLTSQLESLHKVHEEKSIKLIEVMRGAMPSYTTNNTNTTTINMDTLTTLQALISHYSSLISSFETSIHTYEEKLETSSSELKDLHLIIKEKDRDMMELMKGYQDMQERSDERERE